MKLLGAHVVTCPVHIPSALNQMVHLLLGLEVVEEDGALLGLFSPVLDNNAGAVDDLAGVTLTVENA